MDVNQRLAMVERQLRTLRLVTAGLLITLVVLVGIGATVGVPDAIHARMFVVNSQNIGGKIAVLASHGRNGGKLWVLDKNGIPKVELGVTESGNGFIVIKGAGEDTVIPPDAAKFQ